MLNGLTGSVTCSRCSGRRHWDEGRRRVGGVASEPFTASGLSGNVKAGVWGGWEGWLLLVNMTGNKHLGIVFQCRGH